MTLQPVACYRCGRVGTNHYAPAIKDAARESGLWRCGAREACEQRQASNWRALRIVTKRDDAMTGPLAVAGVQSRLSP